MTYSSEVRLRDIPKSWGAITAAISTLGPLIGAGIALAELTGGATGTRAMIFAAGLAVAIPLALVNLYYLDQELREVRA